VSFCDVSPKLGPPNVDLDGAVFVDVGWPKPENPLNDEAGLGVVAAEVEVPPLRKLNELGLSAPKLVAGAVVGAVGAPNPVEASAVGAPKPFDAVAVGAPNPVDAGPETPADGLPNENALVFGCSVGCPNTEVVGLSKSTLNGEA
jgi:hypothetical protein